jgi:hypothetical protein
MNINFDYLIKTVKLMQTEREEIQEPICLKREETIETIIGCLSELRGFGDDGGNWSHLDELSVATNKLKTGSFWAGRSSPFFAVNSPQ